MLNKADLEALTGPDHDAADRVLRSTYDEPALERAWEHWNAIVESALKRRAAISARLDRIRGS